MSERMDSPMFQQPMRSEMATPPGATEGGSTPPPRSEAAGPFPNNVFLGANGIRSGWRLLIFAAIVFVLLSVFGIVAGAVLHGKQPKITIASTAISEAVIFGLFLFASWVMARIEGRKIADYGLPARKAFGKNFWQGAIFGFVAVTILLLSLLLAGVFSVGAMALHGGEILKYGAGWGVAFLFVGFSEEYRFRGYAQFTLATGMGFWPAAILISAGFGVLHLRNGGEDWIGVLSVVGSGLLFCLLLRRTGSLWMAVGFHMAWDWAETFFYGVPDSGIVAPGHLLNPTFHGSKWLTGGSVGPEGSVLVFAILVLCWIIVHFWQPEAKFPNPAALAARPGQA